MIKLPQVSPFSFEAGRPFENHTTGKLTPLPTKKRLTKLQRELLKLDNPPILTQLRCRRINMN